MRIKATFEFDLAEGLHGETIEDILKEVAETISSDERQVRLVNWR